MTHFNNYFIYLSFFYLMLILCNIFEIKLLNYAHCYYYYYYFYYVKKGNQPFLAHFKKISSSWKIYLRTSSFHFHQSVGSWIILIATSLKNDAKVCKNLLTEFSAAKFSANGEFFISLQLKNLHLKQCSSYSQEICSRPIGDIRNIG